MVTVTPLPYHSSFRQVAQPLQLCVSCSALLSSSMRTIFLPAERSLHILEFSLTHVLVSILVESDNCIGYWKGKYCPFRPSWTSNSLGLGDSIFDWHLEFAGPVALINAMVLYGLDRPNREPHLYSEWGTTTGDDCFEGRFEPHQVPGTINVQIRQLLERPKCPNVGS